MMFLSWSTIRQWVMLRASLEMLTPHFVRALPVPPLIWLELCLVRDGVTLVVYLC